MRSRSHGSEVAGPHALCSCTACFACTCVLRGCDEASMHASCLGWLRADARLEVLLIYLLWSRRMRICLVCVPWHCTAVSLEALKQEMLAQSSMHPLCVRAPDIFVCFSLPSRPIQQWYTDAEDGGSLYHCEVVAVLQLPYWYHAMMG